jgi:hypothetical protein
MKQKIYTIDEETYKGALAYKEYLEEVSCCEDNEIDTIFGNYDVYEKKMEFLDKLEYAIANIIGSDMYGKRKLYEVAGGNNFAILKEAYIQSGIHKNITMNNISSLNRK